MAKQSIIDKSELTNFLDCGAILQMGSDQFKLIWGPFTPQSLDLAAISDEKTIIYAPDFWDFISENKKNNLGFFGVKEHIFSRQELLELLAQQNQVEFAMQWGAATEAEFTEQFQWSQSQFASKILTKTVPIISQVAAISFTKTHLVTSLISVLNGNHYGSTYGFWKNTEGFLGHTPELIVDWSHENKKLNTMALAGTMDQRKESVSAILHDEKILDEHQIVVKDMTDVLQTVNQNKKIEVENTKVLELKYLCHLQTPIHIPNVNLQEVPQYLQALHPTAALGLYPRNKEAYKNFKTFKIQQERKNFAAPFAFISAKQAKAVAAIRLFFFDHNQVQITSGCGVTAGSILKDEIKELETKRNSVKRMMGMNV